MTIQNDLRRHPARSLDGARDMAHKAVQLVTKAARANLTAEVSPTSDFTLATRMSVILDSESLQKIRLLPHAIDTIPALPIDIELGIYERSLRTGNAENAGSDGSSVQ